MIMDNCPTCNKKVMNHSMSIKCNVCMSKYHIKCITLENEHITYLLNNQNEWYCSNCLKDCMPFSSIEDNFEFQATINQLNKNDEYNYCNQSDRIFHPFEQDDQDDELYLSDCDPDKNYFNILSHKISSCNYYLESSFNEKIKDSNQNPKMFSLLHINIRSLKSNLHQLTSYLEVLKHIFTVLAVTETWLTEENNDLYQINEYNHIEYHRKDRIGGGVALFIKENIDFLNREKLSIFDNDLESIFIEIDKDQLNTKQNVIIGSVYRPPGAEIKTFHEKLKLILEVVTRENKLCYLMGDYNIDLLNCQSHILTGDFFDLMSSYSFIPLISRPTRVTNNTATLIDNIFTNDHYNLAHSTQGILVTDISDHYPIFYINESIKETEKEIWINKRKYTNQNKTNFTSDLSSIDWIEICKDKNTNDSFEIFHKKLCELHDKHFPIVRLKKKYNNRKPWLSTGLRNSIRRKNKLYRKYRKITSVKNENIYKEYRNKLNYCMRNAEKQYFFELLEKYKSNMKKSWSIIKSIINKNRSKITQSKFRLSDGTLVTNGIDVCDRFNDFFTTIGPTLDKKIPQTNKKPIEYLGCPMINSIYLYPVTTTEINKIVKALKDSSAGYDGISTNLLKESLTHINEVLSYLCNLSLKEGVFPEKLKTANVIPLFKSGDPELFNNYRPVSILCTISKIFEKVMYSRIIDFLNKYKFFVKSQFGFRKDHSTYMPLLVLIDEIVNALDSGEVAVGVFLDFSKAFDTVNHKILLSKLFHYGIRDKAYAWLESYLCNRVQFVSYNGFKSTKNTITCGVPQGSILGPLLFLIYINDLSKICQFTNPFLFADDTNLLHHSKDLVKLQKEINDDLHQISEWLQANRLSLNIKKTHYMIFSNKRLPIDMNIKIDGNKIDSVEQTKFLGVIIDKQLNWKKHITHITGKVARGIGIIIKAKKYLPREAMLSLYYYFIYPYLTYCNLVWGTSCKSHLERLKILQKKSN